MNSLWYLINWDINDIKETMHKKFNINNEIIKLTLRESQRQCF